MKKKYVTIDNSVDFRNIAKIMSSIGFKMNHATARNHMLIALKKILLETSKNLGIKMTKKKITELLKSSEVHNAIGDLLYMIYHDDLKKILIKNEEDENKTNIEH